MIGLPEWASFAPDETIASLKALEIEPDGYVLPAYAAVTVAAAAASEALATGKKITDILSSRDFETVIGPVRFDARGDLADNPYRLFRYDGARFVEVK
jgi:branched-chain amino acid transport system substrate-binding protein